VSKESYFENYVWVNTGYNYVAYKEGNSDFLTKNFKASTLMMGYNILDYEPVHNSSNAAQVLLPLCYIERTIAENMFDNNLERSNFYFSWVGIMQSIPCLMRATNIYISEQSKMRQIYLAGPAAALWIIAYC